MDDIRPNPDDLLKGINQIDQKSKRGKLRIFFGMCPGVGKTYAMLRAAHEKIKLGKNVVIGVIETHKRQETEELLNGIWQVPKKQLQYKGTQIEEFDIDAVLSLKPDIVLVDELAHTNASGSRHPKRYQDIKELIYCGIDVYTTLNVQHIESRSDLVYQIAGIPVRETVPDAFLELADQIEIIDISPEDLLKRLQEGKIYNGERAERAANNFFKEEKLIALRELALRFTAEIVDDQLRNHMQAKRIVSTWNTNERLMVAVSSSPYSARLIRSTRRMAFALEAPWVALYVDTGEQLQNADHERLIKNLNLAKELGAEVVTTKDTNVALALNRTAAEKNVTQLVMGRPERRIIRDFFSGGTILDQLVKETSEVDIHLIRQKRKTTKRSATFTFLRNFSESGTYIKVLTLILLLTALLYPLLPHIGYRAIGFCFLLSILLFSIKLNFGPIIAGTVLSSILWNYLFIPPQFTFQISESADLMMIIAYFAVAITAGFLANKIKKQEQDLTQREQRASILYGFTKNIVLAKTAENIVTEAIKSIEKVIPANVAFLRLDENGQLVLKENKSTQLQVSDKDIGVASWSFRNQKKAGWHTDTLPSSACLSIPLKGKEQNIGVLLLFPLQDKSMSIDQENTIDTICANLSIILESEQLENASKMNEIYEKSEKLHQTLLNSVSHELRTPLTSISGGISVILNTFNENEKIKFQNIIQDIASSTRRLNRTIENLLDMSRLSSGALKLNEHVFELNDFIQTILKLELKTHTSHRLVLNLYKDNLFIKGDEKLLEHVILNIFINATQNAPNHSTIEFTTKVNQSYVELNVLDEGSGIPENQLKKIFERFNKIKDTGGIGLGLSLAKSIIEAHHGIIFAKNRLDRTGSIFTILLPKFNLPPDILK